MPQESFILTELTSGKTLEGGPALKFVWDSNHRNIPVQPWTFGLMQRTVRTDYPGSVRPTEQILGWKFKPFTLRGSWDDRYNRDGIYEAGGYAIAEWRRAELLVSRGNPIRIEHGNIIVEGVVTSFTFNYRRDWDIGYELTVSPHHREPTSGLSATKSPQGPMSAAQLLDESAADVEVLTDLLAAAPRIYATGTTSVDIGAAVGRLESGVASISLALIDNRLDSSGDDQSAPILSAAGLFHAMSQEAHALSELLRPLRASTGLVYATDADITTDYEQWIKLTGAAARTLSLTSSKNAEELRSRAEPDALRLYRPQVGESLYDVSTRFYGTPHNWLTLLQRNQLPSYVLEGTELLIIPDIVSR